MELSIKQVPALQNSGLKVRRWGILRKYTGSHFAVPKLENGIRSQEPGSAQPLAHMAAYGGDHCSSEWSMSRFRGCVF